MCSVVGCDSWRHNAQRFRLPEDPEKRLEWVQFLFEVNGQRLKESSWTDITICSEHFTDDCFVNLILTGTVQLKSGAVPSLCVNTEPEEPVESPQHVEPVETTDAVSQCDDLELCNSSTSSPEKAEHTLTGALTPGSSNTESNKESPALQKGKYAVNENCLLELFGHKCPSCGGKLQMVKFTYGELIVLNQRCLKCDYRNQWKSQVNASVPTVEDGCLTGGTEVTPDTQLAVPTDDSPSTAVLSEIVPFSGEESNASDDGEEGNKGGINSDGEWNSTEEFLLAEELTKESEEETEDEGEEEDFDSPGSLEINELCTECGRFFLILKPHTCEHKVKPYSCNICGKRCVSEISLKNHNKIHNETYEHPCKYCYVTFKTRVDKLKHEQTHQDKKDLFKCPDCPEMFATSKGRRTHLAKHRVSKEFKCGVCGFEFKDIHHLRRHSVVHTGLKPYKCSVCQRGFNQTSHLKSHMRLHTGERPYKCQLCDKCFNHNVSLKSHVQRYHTSSSGPQQREGKVNKREIDAEGNRNERDDVKEKQEVRKERVVKPKSKRRSTGRPRGRPKRNVAGEIKGQRSNTSTPKSKAQKLKKTGSSDEESEDEQSDSDLSFDSAEEEEDEDETMRRSIGSTRRRSKNDSVSDFDPEVDSKKKRYSSQKRRERPKRGLVV